MLWWLNLVYPLDTAARLPTCTALVCCTHPTACVKQDQRTRLAALPPVPWRRDMALVWKSSKDNLLKTGSYFLSTQLDIWAYILEHRRRRRGSWFFSITGSLCVTAESRAAHVMFYAFFLCRRTPAADLHGFPPLLLRTARDKTHSRHLGQQSQPAKTNGLVVFR